MQASKMPLLRRKWIKRLGIFHVGAHLCNQHLPEFFYMPVDNGKNSAILWDEVNRYKWVQVI
jgi:hypothetical protein